MNRTLGVLVRHWRTSTSLLLLACLALGYLLAAPAPPREIRIAVSTAADSAYSQAAEAYAARLEADGVAVTVTRYPGQMHGFASRAKVLPKAYDAIADMAKVLAAHQ